MNLKTPHIIFYDGDCALCSRAVRLAMAIDGKAIYSYAPLKGLTARNLLPSDIPDSIVLLEHANTSEETRYLYGRAVYRILWLIGGMWRLPGLLCLGPCPIGDSLYRWIASRRKKLPIRACPLPHAAKDGRMLP